MNKTQDELVEAYRQARRRMIDEESIARERYLPVRDELMEYMRANGIERIAFNDEHEIVRSTDYLRISKVKKPVVGDYFDTLEAARKAQQD